MKIEAIHDFFDEKYSLEWSQRFEPTRERIALFDLILSRITLLGSKKINILELGIGPGYLANHLLDRTTHIRYEGLDFSEPMLDIAKGRLSRFEHRVNFVQADLHTKSWNNCISTNPDVIVSTWALHDLFSKDAISSVYETAYECLKTNGILLNGDFIKPEDSTFDYEGGRIKPSEHIQLLKEANFEEARCLKIFEENTDYPTTSNNYACFSASKK